MHELPQDGLSVPPWWRRHDSPGRLICILAAVAGGSFALLELIGGTLIHTTCGSSSGRVRGGLVSIGAAIDAFYNEYGYLPDPRAARSSLDARIDTSSPEGQALLTILLGRETGSGMQNPKQIAFLALPIGKNNKNGLMYDARGKITGAFDVWGRGYQVLLDYDGNETLSPPSDSGAVGSLRGRRAAPYSLGPEGKGGTDAIRTW